MQNKNIFQKHQNMRLPYYSYNQPGYYFITICTKNRRHYFGKIIDDKINLSDIGKITKQYWQKIPEHFSNIQLGEYVIMPNHLHGIIILSPVEDRHACPLQDRRQNQKIPVTIGSFKSAVTKKINQLQTNSLFAWQKSYYDHVTRNEKSFFNISTYIMHNVTIWKNDLENLEYLSSLTKTERKLKLKKHYNNLFNK